MRIEPKRGKFVRLTRGAASIPGAHRSPAQFPFERALRAAQHERMQLLIKLLKAWRAARARSELESLSDRTLRDIGLKRGDIGSLFR